MSQAGFTPPLAVAFGADHAGVALKDHLAAVLRAEGFAVRDFGTTGSDSVDNPDFAHRVAAAVSAGVAQVGVLVCGTGIGMSIAANRHRDIRCALAHDVTTARLSRAHNNANVLALGARVVGEAVALDCLRAFLATGFEGGRRVRRLDQLNPSETSSGNLAS
ncbi:MAG TPA: ribose 5-phosphate isomerase B [Acetobacteraceae bacterium]|nr:ribose 5-phosphate isomerase B [Acetobacteraceae bacterium]